MLLLFFIIASRIVNFRLNHQPNRLSFKHGGVGDLAATHDNVLASIVMFFAKSTKSPAAADAVAGLV